MKRRWIEAQHPRLSIVRQCELVGAWRGSSWYYQAGGRDGREPGVDARIDEQYLQTPFYGSRKMAETLGINRKRVQRLMRLMGLEAIYPKRRTTQPGAGHKIYPYLLRNVAIMRPDQVWATRHHVHSAAARIFVSGGGDGLVQPLRVGVAVVEHAGREVFAWRRWRRRWRSGQPEIFNSDQGSQFTARRSPAGWKRPAWRSAWTVAAERWTARHPVRDPRKRRTGQ